MLRPLMNVPIFYILFSISSLTLFHRLMPWRTVHLKS